MYMYYYFLPLFRLTIGLPVIIKIFSDGHVEQGTKFSEDTIYTQKQSKGYSTCTTMNSQ